MILARYINRELAAVFLLTIVVLLLVALGGRFVGYLQEAALGKLSADSLGALLMLRTPEFLQLSLPFGLYLSVLLTLSRLHAEQEISVLASSGVSPTRILLWLLGAAVVVAGVVGWLAVEVTPDTKRQMRTFFASEKVNREFDSLTAGVFHTFDHERRVTYAESLQGGELRDVFMGERRMMGVQVSVWAETGTQYLDEDTGSRFLLLRDGRRYEGAPGRNGYRVIEFDVLGQRIDVPDPDLGRLKTEAFTWDELRAADSADATAEMHWRLALPIMTMVSILLAVGLARVKPRQGRFARIVPGLLAFLGYYVLVLLSQNAIKSGVLPVLVGMWPVHLGFLALSIWLVRRTGRPTRV